MIPSVNQNGGTVARPVSPSWIVEGRTATPGASVLAHRRAAIAVFTAVMLVGVIVALIFGHEYVAEATVRVSPVLPTSLDSGNSRFNSNLDYRDFVQEQVFEINSYATVSGALDQLGDKRSLWQLPNESNRRATERLMRRLKVEPVAESYLVRVALSGSKPDGLADVVNAVVKSYLSRTAKRELEGTDIGFQMLERRQTELEQNIQHDQEQLAGLSQELGVSSVAVGLINPYDKELADSNAALARARRNVLSAQARLDAVKAHRNRIKHADVEAKAEQLAASGTDTTIAKQQLIQKREEALVELSGLGPNHPGRKALESEIDTVNKELSSLDKASLDRARSMLTDSEQATSDVDISEAEANLEQAQDAEKGIEKELDGVKITAATFGGKYNQAVTIHEKLQREQKSLQDTQERMSLLRLKSQAPGVVALESSAMVPDMPEKSTRRIILVLFLFTALALGVGVPTTIDLTDQKVKTPDEYEAILGFPPLGVASSSNGTTSQEKLRRIALGIVREWRTSGIRSFIFTSVREGSNLSLSLALADELNELGVRALAIEASLARSTPRSLNPPGFGSASGRSTKRLAPKVPKTTALENRGKLASQANGDSELQRMQNGIPVTFGYVREIVDRSLGNHDIVLLAGPPLLASADAIAMIQMPAGAILVARAGHDEISDIAAAVRELERCVPPVVGAIICGDAHHNGNEDGRFETAFGSPNSSERGYHYRWIGKRI
jgi:succinoglycan biosynthesis transport protein ExoP